MKGGMMSWQAMKRVLFRPAAFAFARADLPKCMTGELLRSERVNNTARRLVLR
jgi:hypothetical protein